MPPVSSTTLPRPGSDSTASNVVRGKIVCECWSREWLLIGDDRGEVGLIHWYGAPAANLDGHEGPIVHARFFGDDRYALTCSKDGTARLWDREGKHDADDNLRIGVFDSTIGETGSLDPVTELEDVG